jgi:alpha-beta hydrolase superfamily lysophospholipase
MEQLIHNMMKWASISGKRLKQEREIETAFGETLSWQYFDYARTHQIKKRNVPTAILYAEKDHLTRRSTIDQFVAQFGCKLTVANSGEPLFHTSQQLKILNRWTEDLF